LAEIIGIDIGGTKCSVTLGESDGAHIGVLQKSVFMTAGYPTPELAVEKCCEEIGRMTAGRPFAGIGVSCGGPLDSARGVITSPPNLPGWDDVPICKILEERFGVKAVLRNDADACAAAEWAYGAGRGTENFIFLTCGTGLGAGLILGGRLYSGKLGMAGELGHWRMREYGPVGYGKAGSLEGFFSGTGIAQIAESRLLELKQRGERRHILSEITDKGGSPTAQDVFKLAMEKDPLCLGIVEEAGTMLGHGMAMLIDLLNPEIIVGGSIFTRNYSLLYPIVRRAADREALTPSAAHCRILPSELGENIGDISALAAAPLTAYGRENTFRK